MSSTTYKAVVDRDQDRSSSSDLSIPKTGIPRISLDMRAHKKQLAIAAALQVTASCILPIALYYILKYAAKTSDTVSITVSTVVFGAYSIVPLFTRIWSLTKKNSTTRPLNGAKGKHLDYFQLNFIAIFCLMTGLIAGGSSLAGQTNQSLHVTALKIVSMALSIITIIVCSQMVIMYILVSLKPTLHYPFRFSSMTSSYAIRPASYTIAEDVVAVDGKQGTEFRRQLNERYMFSDDIKALFLWADAVWGFSGILVGGGLIAVIWSVHNANIGFVLGWVVPYIWAFSFIWLTIKRTERACREENRRYIIDQN